MKALKQESVQPGKTERGNAERGNTGRDNAELDNVIGLEAKVPKAAGNPKKKVGPENQKAKKSERRKGNPDRRKDGQFGSAKGIETMYRNAYRAQLDLIALAATKANIMISLNGFIASVLMVSGAFIYATEPMFLPPAIVFLVTSVISIYFALWAASPGSSPEYAKLVQYGRTLLTGNRGSRKPTGDPEPTGKDAEPDKPNLLVFEHLAKLKKDDYLERMEALLMNHPQVYQTMSDQLYWLGTMADKKFRMLRHSYAVFGWGIISSVLVLLLVRIYVAVMSPAPEMEAKMPADPAGGIAQFERIYEPSGVEQLEDGRLIVIEDEPTRALSIVSIGPDGGLQENVLADEFLLRSSKRKLNDLEGVAVDGTGYIYAITSHSRTETGKRKQSREQLVRLKIDGNRLVDNAVYADLGNHLGKAVMLARPGNVTPFGGADINIEALSFDKAKQRLLIAFRGPLIDGKAMIAVLENPSAIFEVGEAPRLADQAILLDLQGSGVRSLVYDAYLDGYVLTSEIESDGVQRSALWFWSGAPGDQPHVLEAPHLDDLRNPEGVTPVTVNGRRQLLVVGDNGDAHRKQPAEYLLVDYGEISIK